MLRKLIQRFVDVDRDGAKIALSQAEFDALSADHDVVRLHEAGFPGLEKLFEATPLELETEIKAVRSHSDLSDHSKDYITGFLRLSLRELESKEMDKVARNHNRLTDKFETQDGLLLEASLNASICHNSERNPYLAQLSLEMLARCAVNGSVSGLFYLRRRIVPSIARRVLNESIDVLNVACVDADSEAHCDMIRSFVGKRHSMEMRDDQTQRQNSYIDWWLSQCSRGSFGWDRSHNLDSGLFWKLMKSTDISVHIRRAKMWIMNFDFFFATREYYAAAEVSPNFAVKLIYYEQAFQLAAVKLRLDDGLRFMAIIQHALCQLIEINNKEKPLKPEDFAFRDKLHSMYEQNKKVLDKKLEPHRGVVMKFVVEQVRKVALTKRELAIQDARTDLSSIVVEMPAVVSVLEVKPSAGSYPRQFRTVKEREEAYENPKASESLDSVVSILSGSIP